ncbi:MAG: hypothetical protein HY814_10245 [Candidatus Riflebacteria bacterium]|nr:hypothetical protein [Candidatus Riflebacteria bacterium]
MSTGIADEPSFHVAPAGVAVGVFDRAPAQVVRLSSCLHRSRQPGVATMFHEFLP